MGEGENGRRGEGVKGREGEWEKGCRGRRGVGEKIDEILEAINNCGVD